MSQALTSLLEAEAVARGLSRGELLDRLARRLRFNPRRVAYHQALLEAIESAPAGSSPIPAVQRIVDQLRLAGLARPVPSGPILLVCESRTFGPDLDNPVEQLLVRLLASLKSLGASTWILRLPHRSARLCNLLLEELPGDPAGIVSVEVSHPGCLELLSKRAPLVQLGMKSMLMRRLPCVEHDTALEAVEIATLAADRRADQVAFVGLIREIAGRRRIRVGDARLQSLLAMEAQNRHIALPSHLQLWADVSQSLEQAGILQRLAQQNLSRTLLVVAGLEHADQAAAFLAGREHAGLICRNWAPDSENRWPTVGQDLDLLTSTALLRLLNPRVVSTELALLVPPKWYGRV